MSTTTSNLSIESSSTDSSQGNITNFTSTDSELAPSTETIDSNRTIEPIVVSPPLVVDYTDLIAIIAGSVGGGLLLCAIVAVVVWRLRRRHNEQPLQSVTTDTPQQDHIYEAFPSTESPAGYDGPEVLRNYDDVGAVRRSEIQSRQSNVYEATGSPFER